MSLKARIEAPDRSASRKTQIFIGRFIVTTILIEIGLFVYHGIFAPNLVGLPFYVSVLVASIIVSLFIETILRAILFRLEFPGLLPAETLRRGPTGPSFLFGFTFSRIIKLITFLGFIYIVWSILDSVPTITTNFSNFMNDSRALTIEIILISLLFFFGSIDSEFLLRPGPGRTQKGRRKSR